MGGEDPSSGPKSLGEGRGGDPGGWRRTLRAPAVWSRQSAGRAAGRAAARSSGRRGRRAAASPRGRRRRRCRTSGPGGGRRRSKLLRASQPSVHRPRLIPRGPGAAGARGSWSSPLSSGSLGTWASGSEEGRVKEGAPTCPHPYHPQPTPSRGPLFQPRSPARAVFYPREGLGVLDSSFPDQSFLIKRLKLGVGVWGWLRGVA